MDVIDVLREFSSFLLRSNLIIWVYRQFMWALVQVFSFVLNSLEKLLDGVYELVTFSSSSGVGRFVQNNRVAVFAVGTLCMILFFLGYMRNSKKYQLPTLMDNLLLGIGVILLSTTLTDSFLMSSFSVAKAIYQSDGSTSQTIIRENICDVVSFDTFGWSSADKATTIEYSDDAMEWLDITEEVKASDFDFENKISKEVFTKKVIVNAEGTPEVVNLNKGMFTINEYYYRYSWSPWTILGQLILSIIIVLATSYKYTKAIYNASFNGIIAPFFAFSDLVEAAKVKKILMGIVNTCINVVLFAVSLRMYRLMVNFINSNKEIDSIQGFILQVFIAFIVVEGPFIIQELTGQESGIGSAVKQTMGMAALAAYGGKKGLPKLKDGFDKMKNGVKQGGSFIGGLASGAFQHAGESDTLDQDMKAASSDNTDSFKPKDNALSPDEMEAFEKEVKNDLTGSNKATDSLSAANGATEATDSVDLEEMGLTKGSPLLSSTTNKALSKGSDKLAAGPSPLSGGSLGSLSEASEGEGTEAKETTNSTGRGFTPNLAMAKPLDQAMDQALSEASDTLGQPISLGSQMAINKMMAGDSLTSQKPAETMGMPEQVKAAPGLQQLKNPNAGNVLRQSIAGKAVQSMASDSLSAARPGAYASLAGTSRTPSASFTPSAAIVSNLSAGQVSSVANVSRAFTKPLSQVHVPQLDSLTGVQQFKTDLANSSRPLTTDTVGEVLSNKYADRKIEKAQKNKKYRETYDLGKNTSYKGLSNFEPRKRYIEKEED
ncbi:hypothetical protein HED42_16605 [Enterococcus casseliflavus]|uniref:pLS20_p028 family conjugation system transmembrane protein n=1 Tax=Enterococcus casseliflavus TaxID=37734 RepID=UPI001433425A|nr:hypothetical protein [Enterococcus casseliflavus]NKD39756.1 hypothetical protein [Enterococcus casseliflavus]